MAADKTLELGFFGKDQQAQQLNLLPSEGSHEKDFPEGTDVTLREIFYLPEAFLFLSFLGPKVFHSTQ